ncbi:hypothetical protein WJ32_18495 (plasmid) [Burkholderia ubonensis]|uniref:Flagellar biosynthesis protein FlhB n=1 Tax=Burkholderia ubonensis TaxID=101571 RepID=A0A103RNG8_9BURK|nr:hypothetical protein WJ32_18495 [Burkholderia ubonensis]KVG71115.1 hypothetical protein WJ33_21215 [Burkholderia ubonensis]
MNPVEGIKRFLSPLILFEFIRTLVKVVAFSLAMIFIVLRIFRELPAHQFDAMGLLSSLSPMSWASVRILILIAAAFALFDVFIVKRRFSKQMMMSRREVREEARNREGDPRIRQRRRQLQREMLRRASSMRGVREADVLVVNPVHFAIALRFDRGTMIAPQVTAKGAGEFALRLKSIAFTYGVPIVEDRVLARKLFFQIKLKECIGETFYKSVGKIYVNLRHKPSGGGAA